MADWDATGMERVPFDGRVPAPTVTYASPPAPHHGPRCRPSNPEIGCVCGEDERQSLYDEAHPQVRMLEPGQQVLIYGDVPVTVRGVVPDPEPHSRYVTLQYRRHGHQGHLDGIWKLDGHRRLPLIEQAPAPEPPER